MAEALHRLTPFAVDYRYEVLDEDTEAPLDRPALRAEVERLRTWVELQLKAKEQ